MPEITPCLWFDDQLEEAATFYTSIFPRSHVRHLARVGGDEGEDGARGAVTVGEFDLDGLRFRAINGGPQFRFTEAVSFSVRCADQAEVDHYWDSLTADGGEESMCGWLKDRFGLSWQIVPARLDELLSDSDPARAQASAQAMLQMRRIVVADLEAAADAVG